MNNIPPEYGSDDAHLCGASHVIRVVVNDESKHSTFSRINIVICFIPCGGPSYLLYPVRIPCGGRTGRAS
ncbi:hypothetical protein J6590_092882 [Homalodisca vitripennis]|nr:hypothetical protein J6590_092882 [Homalodisca vitripennis]